MSAGPLVHAASCPEPVPIVRPNPTRHLDRVIWCPGCLRHGIEPLPQLRLIPDLDPLEET